MYAVSSEKWMDTRAVKAALMTTVSCSQAFDKNVLRQS